MRRPEERSLADYLALLEKVSTKFDEIHARNASRMRCGRGCHSCCAPELTVFAVERENLRRFIESAPGLEARLKALEAADPHRGARCKMLDASGVCSVYEARPVVCRSHGAPIFAKSEGGAPIRDACPLNFEEIEDLMKLPAEDVINIDLLNQILALVNRRFVSEGDGNVDEELQRRRYQLRVHDIVSSRDGE